MSRDISESEAAALGAVVIIIDPDKQTSVAFIRGHKVPITAQVDYGAEPDDKPLSLRRVDVMAGWNKRNWSEGGVDLRHRIADGSDEWQALRVVDS